MSRLALPLEPDTGTRLTLGDDDSRPVRLSFAFPFYGKTYTDAFVNSDGNLTFVQKDDASTERSVGRLVSGPPRVAPLLADLDPSTGGSVSMQDLRDHLTVTWRAVPQFDRSDRNTFQVTLWAERRSPVAVLFAEGQRLFTRPLVVLSLAVLGVIPLLSFPGYSDFVMRASMPALFIVALQVIASGLDGLRRRELRVVPLLLVFALGALHPLGMYRQSIARFSLQMPRLDEVPQLPDLTNPSTKRRDGLQYIGRMNTPFFEYLARR